MSLQGFLGISTTCSTLLCTCALGSARPPWRIRQALWTAEPTFREGASLMEPKLERILRAHARFLRAGIDIDPELSLASLGVDSLDIIELIVQIEGEFDMEIPPDRVTPETFSTPTSIWRLLCQLDPNLAVSESSRL
jgi:acyl carrier protein